MFTHWARSIHPLLVAPQEEGVCTNRSLLVRCLMHTQFFFWATCEYSNMPNYLSIPVWPYVLTIIALIPSSFDTHGYPWIIKSADLWYMYVCDWAIVHSDFVAENCFWFHSVNKPPFQMKNCPGITTRAWPLLPLLLAVVPCQGWNSRPD